MEDSLLSKAGDDEEKCREIEDNREPELFGVVAEECLMVARVRVTVGRGPVWMYLVTGDRVRTELRKLILDDGMRRERESMDRR